MGRFLNRGLEKKKFFLRSIKEAGERKSIRVAITWRTCLGRASAIRRSTSFDFLSRCELEREERRGGGWPRPTPTPTHLRRGRASRVCVVTR